jgi:hypothetical protein
MNIQKIIHEGNIKVARAWLAAEYLHVSQLADSALIPQVLDVLDQQGHLITADDFEACQLLRILLDGFPSDNLLYPVFLSRLSAIEEKFQHPFTGKTTTMPPLKVKTHDRS